MTGQYVLAIDVGSSGVRAIIVDSNGHRRGGDHRELTTSFPRPGWAEQDPAALWASATAVVAEALRASGLTIDRVKAIGVANQRSSVVAWDAKTLTPLAPIVLWHDVRTEARCQELMSRGFFVTPNMAVTKAEWILRNVVGVAEAAATGRLRFGGVESWLCANLSGGCHATDHGNASATGLYAHFERAWDHALLEAIGVERGWLPSIHDSIGVIALTSSDQIGASIPIGGMTGDQQASLYGLACHEYGQMKCSYGTAAMVDATTGPSIAIAGPGTYPLVGWSVDGTSTYCVEGSVVTAGAAVQWLRDGLGVLRSVADAGDAAESVTNAGGVWVVPAFQGLGTPLMEATARAMIGGLSRGSTAAHVVRALLEGIAHRVADAADAVWQMLPPPTALRVDGGASRNDFLMQAQADWLGLPVERSREPDGAALGVAAMAARAVGVDGPLAVCRWNAERTFEPRLSADARAAGRAVWRKRLATVAAAKT